MNTTYTPRHALTVDQRVALIRDQACVTALTHVLAGDRGRAEYTLALADLRITNLLERNPS